MVKGCVGTVVAGCLAVAVGAAAQTRDAAGVLAEARAAMGGKKLDALTALSATGRTQRSTPDGR